MKMMNYYSYHIFTIITNVFRYFPTYFPFQGLLVNEQKCLYRGGRKRKRRGDRDTILLLPRIQVFYRTRWIENVKEKKDRNKVEPKREEEKIPFPSDCLQDCIQDGAFPTLRATAGFFLALCPFDKCSLKLLIFKQDKELTPNKMRCQLVVS